MAQKKISELASLASATDADIIAIVQGGATYKITKGNLLALVNLVLYKENVFDVGSLGSGTYTPNCEANGNNQKITLTGGITVAVPSASLSGNEAVGGIINFIDADSHSITWDAGWDFGAGGAPTLSSNMLIGFYRRAGDAKTKAWHAGGFS